MKLRQNHPILDRIKLLIILLLVACILGSLAKYIDEENSNIKNSTIEHLIETALEPVGSTMYIWGGGWDDEDSEAGATSTQIGVSEQWEIFASQQDETYNFENHRFERANGLDCSGYVGWVVYNTFEEADNQPGYVTASTEMAEVFAESGWGILIENPMDFLPGDIVSMKGHVWICLGTCADGSVLLVHSSPPGVSVCGTQIKEGESSLAIELATQFMTENYPEWQEKYPNRTVAGSYLENVSVFRWSERTMLDAEKMQNMSGEEIIVYMAPDI